MVRRKQRERSVVEVLLLVGHKLWPDWLGRIDTVFEDEAVLEVVAQVCRRGDEPERPLRTFQIKGQDHEYQVRYTPPNGS